MMQQRAAARGPNRCSSGLQRGCSSVPMDKPAGYGRSEFTATNVEGGGRRRGPSNVATRSEKHHTRY
jgi:hypothetical protein